MDSNKGAVDSAQQHGYRLWGTVSGQSDQRSGVEVSSAGVGASVEQTEGIAAMPHDEQTRESAGRALAHVARRNYRDGRYSPLDWSRDDLRVMERCNRILLDDDDRPEDAGAKGLPTDGSSASRRKAGSMRTKIKNTPLFGLKTGPDDGLAEREFVVYPSTFTRTPDSYGDVIAKGAFTETLAEWKASGKTLPGLFGHRIDDPSMYVAKASDYGEDDHGWWVKGVFDEHPTAQQVYELVKDRRISQLSFAYDVLDQGPVTLPDGSKANELRRLKVLEFSFVPVPANPDTSVVAVKATIPSKEKINMNPIEQLAAAVDEARQLEVKVKAGDHSAVGHLEETKTKIAKLNDHIADAKKAAKLFEVFQNDDIYERSQDEHGREEWVRTPGAASKSGSRLSLKGVGPRLAEQMRGYSHRVSPSSKGLVPSGESVLAVPLVNPDDPIAGAASLERPARLIDVLPMTTRDTPVYKHLVQREVASPGGATVVAPGATKPTLKLSVGSQEARLRVVAVLSEPIDRFMLEDAQALNGWVTMQLADSIQDAIEIETLTGDGTGEHFTGLARTSGVQVQPLIDDRLVTLQYALSKLQGLGITPAFIALAAVDWLAIQTTRNTSGNFDLGGPIDATAQTAWGVKVVVVPGLAAGDGYVVGSDTVNLSTDAVLHVDWGTPGDAFTKNQLVARVETRANLDVLRPHGVIRLQLTEDEGETG